jgi:hypothetical protein
MGDGILALSFAPVHRFRPFALLPREFRQVHRGGGDLTGLTVAAEGPAAPYASVEVRVSACTGTVAAGLMAGPDDGLMVRWRARSQRLSLIIVDAGKTRTLRWTTLSLPPVFGLAFVLCENQVTAMVDRGSGWTSVLTERRRVRELTDLRQEDVLSRHHFAWAGESTRVDSVDAGPFGMVGVRDPRLVQNADGTPHVRGGRFFLTWTCSGLGFFPQAHWSVWSLDPETPGDMRLEALIFFRRDGLVVGDHAGQLVRDGDQWLVAISSWGDFGESTVHVREATSTLDLLTGVHVLDSVPVELPTSQATWDPGMSRIDGRWHVTFVESPSQNPFRFHPVLARTPTGRWTEGLERVGTAEHLDECEGPLLVDLDGDTWMIASDGASRTFPVFDLRGHRTGDLHAPYPSNIPHPQLVPQADGSWLMVTFDGTAYDEGTLGYGTHGDVVIMSSAPSASGVPEPARGTNPFGRADPGHRRVRPLTDAAHSGTGGSTEPRPGDRASR